MLLAIQPRKFISDTLAFPRTEAILASFVKTERPRRKITEQQNRITKNMRTVTKNMQFCLINRGVEETGETVRQPSSKSECRF